MKKSIHLLLTGALAAGLISGSKAFADDKHSAGSDTDKVSKDSESCKSDSCGGEDGCGKQAKAKAKVKAKAKAKKAEGSDSNSNGKDSSSGD